MELLKYETSSDIEKLFKNNEIYKEYILEYCLLKEYEF